MVMTFLDKRGDYLGIFFYLWDSLFVLTTEIVKVCVINFLSLVLGEDSGASWSGSQRSNRLFGDVRHWGIIPGEDSLYGFISCPLDKGSHCLLKCVLFMGIRMVLPECLTCDLLPY